MGWWFCAIAAAGTLWVVWLCRRRARRRRGAAYDTGERQHMPDELAHGKLLLSETRIITDSPRPLGARVDQVFLAPQGYLVPVETKRRQGRRVYAYDVIELSVQAVILRRGKTGLKRYPVANWGWVRAVRRNQKPQYIRAHLLGDQELVALYERYQDLRKGRATPDASGVRAICRKCAYAQKCPHPWQQQGGG